MTRALCAAALLLFTVPASGCTRIGAGEYHGHVLHAWTHPDVVRIGLYEEPDSLNPIISTMVFSTDVYQLIFDGLIRFDPKGRAIPDLAREVPSLKNGGISKDGLTLTYHLMPNARWSDGVPVTAEDVIFTWHQIMNPANNVASRDIYDRIASMDAPDPHTLRVRLKLVYPPAVFMFSNSAPGAIVPKHLLAGNPNVNALPFNTKPIGSGPYVLSSWEHGSEMRFDANPHYFRGVPKIPHVVLRFIPDQNTLISQLQTHDIDLYYNVSPAQMPQVKWIGGLRIVQTPGLKWEHLTFNVRHPPLDERDVRLALCYATDEQAIYDKIYFGLGGKAPTHYNPAFGWGDPHVTYYPYDPRKANAILDAAGWKLGPDGIRYKNGRALAFTIESVAGVKRREQLEVYLQNAWHAIGAQVSIRNAPAATIFAPAQAGGLLNGGKLDVALFEYDDTTPDPDHTDVEAPDRIPPLGQNTSFYSNAEIARLDREGLETFDPAKRRPVYAALSRILIAEVPEYVVDWIPEIDASNPDLRGVQPVPVGSDLWNINDWSY